MAVRSRLIASVAARASRSPAGVSATSRGRRRNSGLVEPAFQRLDLPADRRLGHPEFLGGAREAEQARGRLEDPDGAERDGGERIRHKGCLWIHQENRFVSNSVRPD